MGKTYKLEEVIHHDRLPAKILHQKLKNEDCFVPLHWHKDIEFNLMMKGNTEITVNGKINRVMQGEYIFINSKEIHMLAPPVGIHGFEPDMELLTILWDYDFLKYYSEYSVLYFDLEQNAAVKREIGHILIKIAELFINKEKYYEMEITAQLLSIGRLLLKYCAVFPKADDSTIDKSFYHMQKAVDYIEKNYNEGITLKQMADIMGMAPTYFSRKFHAVTGFSFSHYLNDCRLRNAMNDIANSDMTMTEIAYENGFSNVKSFIETFKRTLNVTPYQYKKQMKNQ